MDIIPVEDVDDKENNEVFMVREGSWSGSPNWGRRGQEQEGKVRGPFFSKTCKKYLGSSCGLG
jgi:hypothetical protein